MEQVMVGLLLWIGQHTHFEYHPDMGLPAVEQVTQQELASLYFGTGSDKVQGFASDEDEETKTVIHSLTRNLRAIYSANNNTIYLGKSIDPTSTYGRSILIHELVHFLQNKHEMHKQVACNNALEKDAYIAQSHYMVQNKVIPSFNKFSIMMRSLCESPF